MGSNLYRALNNQLATEPDGLTAKLFQQWATFFGESTELAEFAPTAATAPEIRSFANGLGITGGVDVSRLLFTAHTYYALLIKLIAYLALSRHAGVLGTRFGTLASLADDALKRELASLERGGVFAASGYHNFLEGDFFGWYVHAWSPELAASVRDVIDRLRGYDPATTDVNPESTRDLLKLLYQYLMPRPIRHRLGEYYTPDWLASRLLQVSGFAVDPRRRMLDPACGSGTFLVLAIREMRRACERAGLNERETLDEILGNCVGVDLNPLAVIAARTNYFLALGDLLEHRTTDIEIPVYLADSILPPSPGRSIFGRDTYELSTAVGTFIIPSVLRSEHQIQLLTSLLDEYVSGGFDSDAFVERCEHELGIPASRWDGSDGEGRPATEPLLASFRLLQQLHHDELDGLWARIVKNAFMPLFLGKFDLVVGNPPWIGWEDLPTEYRERTSHLRDAFGLTPRSGGFAGPRLGSVKLDLSYLMTYVVAQRHLSSDGALAFLITQSAFKSLGSGEGFRRFLLPDSTGLQVQVAEDLTDLQPFEAATNRTASFVMKRGASTQYPVPYKRWKRLPGSRRPGHNATLDEVLATVEVLDEMAEPVDPRNPRSPWLTGTTEVLSWVRRVVRPSDYEAHLGANTGGANGVFWLQILEEHGTTAVVRNESEAARRGIETWEAQVERARIHPLLKSGDAQRWASEPSSHIVEAQDPRSRARAMTPESLQREWPRT